MPVVKRREAAPALSGAGLGAFIAWGGTRATAQALSDRGGAVPGPVSRPARIYRDLTEIRHKVAITIDACHGEPRLTEPANPKERRLVLRLLAHWRELCGEADLPARAAVDGAAIPDMWDYCFVIDVDGAAPAFAHFGAWHRTFCGADMTGRALADLAPGTLAERATRHLPEVLARRVPITYGGALEEPPGRKLLYRSILLPLTDGGARVVAALGGANCRVFQEDPEI